VSTVSKIGDVPVLGYQTLWMNNHSTLNKSEYQTLVSHKLCGFQGHVGKCIVMMEPAVVAPKLRSFS
jgi:hypothetical protein